MTRRCADSVTATDIPVNDPTTGKPWALVLGYIDGRYAWSQADWNRFPASRHVRIAVFSTTNDGDAIDRELGDATAAQAVDWVLMRRRAGHPAPIVYCSYSDWGNCRNAFHSRGVPEPGWWIAGYPNPTDGNGNPVIPPGAMAHQFTDTPGGHWDESLVADYVPGIDPVEDSMVTSDDAQAIAKAVWDYTITRDGQDPARAEEYETWDNEKSGAAQTAAEGVLAQVTALTAKVDAITAALADLKSAQPSLSGSFSISGTGSVSSTPPTPQG